MARNPLCGFPLGAGAKIIAFIDIFVGILITVYLIHGIVSGFPGKKGSAVDSNHPGNNTLASEPIEEPSETTVWSYINQKLDGIIIAVVYIAVEGWLFSLLVRAVRKVRNLTFQYFFHFTHLKILDFFAARPKRMSKVGNISWLHRCHLLHLLPISTLSWEVQQAGNYY